ncbi:hypothetical protein FWF89_03595 [Candidatus Saccharibacteria bacterium]|nr:hypothetical protein [Candidatus Saccharibacteria bacterium]
MVEKIKKRTEQIKQKYGVGDTEMSSFSPDLLPTNERPMMLSEDAYADYQRILELTNENNIEYNFLWLGNRRELDGQEYYSIEKAVVLPQVSMPEQSSVNPLEKIRIYDSIDEHDGYDVIIDGHSHPAQDSTYKDFDKLPQPMIDELSLKKPGKNYSISDFNHYLSLLNGRSEVKDKIIIGSVITFAGDLLTAVSDPNDDSAALTTIRQIGFDVPGGVDTLPTSEFDEEKSRQFFEG